MDSSVEKGSGSLDPDERTASGETKACTDCNATKTPLWRGGPSGPKVSRGDARSASGSFGGGPLLRDFPDLRVPRPAGLIRPIWSFSFASFFIQSLCNACGIRYRKKRREALGLDGPKRREQPASVTAACPDDADAAGGDEGEEDQRQHQQLAKTTKKSKRVGGRDAVTVELRMVGFGKEVVLKQRRRMRRRRRLGEEEKAAILLMALSSGVIYAS
uniref:Uncharacterized protein n=1 Tax=Avena sativa TaxID=4498 RepID=A0ACD6ABD9_AVESA